MNSSFPPFLFFLLRIPYFLVVVAGLVLALMCWRRMPMVAFWATLGFGCLLAGGVAAFTISPAMQLTFTHFFGLGSLPSPDNIFLMITLTTSLLSTAGLAMLTVAVFGWRQPAALPR